VVTLHRGSSPWHMLGMQKVIREPCVSNTDVSGNHDFKSCHSTKKTEHQLKNKAVPHSVTMEEKRTVFKKVGVMLQSRGLIQILAQKDRTSV